MRKINHGLWENLLKNVYFFNLSEALFKRSMPANLPEESDGNSLNDVISIRGATERPYRHWWRVSGQELKSTKSLSFHIYN